MLKLVNFLVKLIPSCPKISQLEMEYGQLVSPNFPDKYPNSQDCSWVLTVPTGFYVALKFQSFEVHYNSTYICNCKFDFQVSCKMVTSFPFYSNSRHWISTHICYDQLFIMRQDIRYKFILVLYKYILIR